MNFSVNGVMFTRKFVNEENKRKRRREGRSRCDPAGGFSRSGVSPFPSDAKKNPPGNPGGLRFFARFFICGFKRFLFNYEPT